ncbi:MAG: hypothetical protein PHO31_01255 [Candidatus Pacebacteria bacterium]|nr:hypothetical protein [Candidatus Paceibacterota bacterium]
MNIFSLFLEWYFVDLPSKIIDIWENFLWFFWRFFSIKDLTIHFFSPWRRQYFTYSGGFNIGEWFGNLVFNLFSRFMGMILRTILIVIGIVVEIIVVILGLLVFVFWIFFPFLIILSLLIAIFPNKFLEILNSL